MRLFSLLFFVVFLSLTTSPQTLYINETMASNSRTLADASGSFEDWIEIYNPDTIGYFINDYYISNSTQNPTAFRFPGGMDSALWIPPGGYLVLWASEDTSKGPMHLPFSLSASGDAIVFSNPNGILLDAVIFGAQKADASYGRTIDGAATWSFFGTPTPKASNALATPYNGFLSPPVILLQSGFYNHPVNVSLTHSDPDATILYTMDGSDPSEELLAGLPYPYKDNYPLRPTDPVFPLSYDTVVAHVYTQSIRITDRSSENNDIASHSTTYDTLPFYAPNALVQKATLFRAVAVKPGYLPSVSTTRTYFIDENTTSRYTLPVVSLVLDKRFLFDYEKGFITAGKDYEDWRDTAQQPTDGWVPANWRREELEYVGAFEVFDVAKQLVVSQNIGVRIHGGWSRARRKKSFRLYPRNAYGASEIQYPIFKQSTDNNFKRLVLRNSGNDELNTLFRDAFMQDLTKHLHFDIQLSEPVVVFLNGEYNGIYNFREFQNRHYIERKYGVTEKELDFISNNDANDGDRVFLASMLNYISNNSLDNPAHVAELNTRMDIENFLDYVIAQIYIRNTDWPGNNVKAWRKRTPYTPSAPAGQDGRFRWLMYDTDFGFGLDGGVLAHQHNSLVEATQYGNVGFILRHLFDNDSIVRFFAHRYSDLINTSFQSDFVIHLIDSMTALYQPEIAENKVRWNSHPDVKNWRDLVNVMRIFAANRPEFARQHLRDYFNLGTERALQLSINQTDAGYIQCNTINIRPQTRGISSPVYPWTGHYYDSIPIPLTAIPNPGYDFSYWLLGNDTLYQSSIAITLPTDTHAVAVFVKDTQFICTSSAIWNLAACPYDFHYWSASSFPGSAPNASQFVFFDQEDPSDTAAIFGNVLGRYDLTSRTRINGLGERGVSFVNTGNQESNPGYAPARLGGLLVSLNTKDVKNAFVQWTAGTLLPQSRAYGIKLQYRIGTTGPFFDVVDKHGNAVKYLRNVIAGHEQVVPAVALPNNLLDRDCVQLLWRYYYTGVRFNDASGARDILRLDDVFIVADSLPKGEINRSEIYQKPIINGLFWVDQGDTVTYSTSSTLPNPSYNWTVENGTILGSPNSTSVRVVWNTTQPKGRVQLEIASGSSCNLLGSEEVFVANLQLPNASESLPAAVFPNPNNGHFSLYLKPEIRGKVMGSIYNTHGEQLFLFKFENKGKQEIQVDLAQGIYYLRLYQAETNFSSAIKFIIIRN